MLHRELTTDEIVKIATEVLNWELPVTITPQKLQMMKDIAGSALTQTHDQLKDPFNRLSPIVIKPNISVSDLAKLNRSFKK